MRRPPAIVVLLALCLPAVAAAADPVPGTARFAVPERGTAVVVPSDGSLTVRYLPFAAARRSFTIFMRLPAGNRTRTVLVRHKPARQRCAASHRLDRGVPLRLAGAGVEPGGYLTAATPARRWALLGTRRFCIWPTANPAARVRPVSSTIRFFGAGIGAVQWADREVDGTSGVVTHVVATAPFTYAQQVSGCPVRPVGPARTATPSVQGLAATTTFNPASTVCDFRSELVVSSSPVGAFSMALNASEAAGGTVRHAGMCAFLDAGNRPDDARRLIEQQGCRVGRTIRSRSGDDIDPPDWVWKFTVNGAEAPLVPQGTTVDMVVNTRP